MGHYVKQPGNRVVSVAVLLVTAYGKNQRGNISKAEVNEMAKLMKELKAQARGSNT